MSEEGKLTDQQERFVEEYLIDLNATAAATRAGYSDGNYGRQLIAKPNVTEAIIKAKKKRSKRTQITMDRVLQEYARVAFVDLAELYDEHGHLRSVHDIPEDARRAVGGVDSARLVYGSGEDKEIEYVKKLRMLDKVKALNDLMRHLGGFEQDNKQQAEGRLRFIMNLDGKEDGSNRPEPTGT